MLLFLLGSLNVWGAETELFSQSYPGSPSKYVGSYTGSFTITTDGYTLTYANVNNGQQSGSGYPWSIVRAGRNGSNASIATITSGQIAEEVSKVSINFTQVDASKTNELYLEVADNASFNSATKISKTIATGAINFTIASPAENQYYRIVIDLKAGSSNGFTRFDGVTFYQNAGGSSDPTISVEPVGAKCGVGDEVTLSLEAAPHTSGKTLSYQWYSNSSSSTEGASEVGTNSASYVPSTASAVTTYYYCVVSEQDGGSTTSNIVAVEVKTPQDIVHIMPTSSTEGAEFLLNDVTVTYANGKNIYVKDDSGYMLVYDNNSAISGAANGKVLHGLWGKAKLYNGLPEISTVTQAPTVTDGSAVEPEDLDADPTDDDLNKYVTLEGVTFASAQTLSTTGSIENITGSFKSSNLTIRNNFKIAASLAAGTSYRVVGVVQKYNSGYQVYPISFEEQADPTVTLSPAALDFGTIGVGDDAPAVQTFTVSGSNLTENLTASVTAGSDYYDIAVTAGSLNQDGGTVSATITVTPKSAISASAGTKAGTVTVSGNGLSETVSLSAEVKAKHTVTWNNNGTLNTTQVIDGEKPSFPTTPVPCDATSTTFVGWATAPWEDKIDDLAGKTVHTSNATMDAVTTDDIVYYAVFAKSVGGAFDGTTGGEFYIYADIDDTKYYAKAFASKIESTTDIAEAVKYTFEKIEEDETTYFAIKSGDYYLGWSSSTNFTINNAEPVKFKPESGQYGTWRLMVASTIGAQTPRSFVYRTGTTNKFAPYAVSGIDGTEYYDVEIGSGASMSDYMTTCCEKHSITIDSEIANGNVVADKDEACEGKKVTLTPTADPAYHFGSWSVTYNDGEEKSITPDGEGKFDMPAYDVTVSASFVHDPCTNLSAPTLNGAIAVTYNSATINWNSVAHAVSYDVVIVRHSDSEPIFSGNVTATDKALTGLDPETQYDYSIMGVGDGSDYCTSGNNTLEGNFTTSALPEVQLWLVKKQGAAAVDGGKHALGVEFDITPSDLSCTKTFVGWTDAANKDYTHATDAPSVLINKYTFTTEDAVTLYAVYADVTPGATTYTLTPATSMSEGTYVIAAYDENYKALTGAVSSGKLVNETTGSAIDGEGKLVSLPTDACEFTFTAVTGGYSIQKPNDDYLGYTSTSDNNKLAFGDYSSLVWSVNANAKEGSPVNGVSLTTSAYKVSANASAGSDTWVRGYKSSGSIYQPIYLFKKAAGASTATNYATTCADAPEATPSPTSVEAVAAGASGTITMSYENVNTSALDVTLCNDAAGKEAFTGDWLSASLSSTNISYTVNPNTTYEARTAYIKLTAPETTDATDPAVVIIPVTQAKYIPEFASLADLVAANIPTGTDVKVSFSHIKISADIAIISGQRKGVYLEQKAANNKDIEIYYAASPYVPTEPTAWVKNGYVSATNLQATWTYYNSNDVWELIPAGGFNWASDLTYEGPAASQISVTPSGNIEFATVEQGADLPSGETLTVTLTNVESATATLVGDNFSIDKTDLTDGDEITVSVVSTATVGDYSATLTISDNATENPADPVVINVIFIVETPETPVSTTSQWVAATEITEGMQVLIVGERNDKVYAVGAQTTNNRTAVEGSLNEGIFTPGENTMAFTVVAQDGGKFALQASNGKYLYAAGSGSGKNYLRSQAEVDGNAKWTLSVSSATANGTNTNNQLKLNNSNDIFSCYSSGQKSIAFYVPQPAPAKEVIRGELSNGKWGTICPKQTVENVEGATFYQISYLEEQGGLPYNVVFDQISGTTLTAGQPYFFIAEGEEIRGIKTGAELTEAGDGVNGFYGYIGASSKELTVYNTDYNAAANNTFVIHNNSVFRINQGGTMLKSERCYININSTEPSRTAKSSIPGRRRISMSVQNTNVATGVDAINASETPMKLMIDGQLFILRGEKMYDATGRLVK